MRTGVAYLPLHFGKCPPWLFSRMRELSRAIVEVLLAEFGQKEVLRRMADPYWFQAFGNVLGFDWHSSGLTTTVCGALKEALNKAELEIWVAGGKGKTSRKAPQEIEKIGEKMGLTSKKVEKLKRASRLAAKVDNSAVQDGYQLYHHIFLLSERGNWAVIQQGMNPENHYARRYHWLSDELKSFVEEPHSGFWAVRREQRVLNMTAKESKEARKISVDLVCDGPKHLRKFFQPGNQSTLQIWSREEPIVLKMPRQVNWKVLDQLYESQPRNYEEVLEFRGVGPKTIRALALISELVYGARASWRDPVKFSYAHGGKDGVPYPVNRKRYDASIRTLREAIEMAKIGRREKLEALKRLQEFSKDL